jgi:hypothetical protein
MAQYQLSSVAHIPVPLTDLAYAFRQDMTEYQHDKICRSMSATTARI